MMDRVYHYHAMLPDKDGSFNHLDGTITRTGGGFTGKDGEYYELKQSILDYFSIDDQPSNLILCSLTRVDK